MFRWSVVLLALLATAPTIWAAFAEQSVDVTAALEHYLIALVVFAVLLGLVRSATKSTTSTKSPPKRRAADQGKEVESDR